MNLGAYIHVPFCRSRCNYCDFNTYAGLDHLIEPYVAALEWQICHASGAAPDAQVDVPTVYFGGGTPSLLAPEQVERILSALRGSFRISKTAEVSLEANPGAVSAAYLRRIRAIGVNRLSLGVQSFDDGALASLGRIHTAEQARESLRLARQVGFDNVSLDLMFGLPGQSLIAWQQTLSEAVALRPDHLSLYALTLDDDTPLGKAVTCGECVVPDGDAAADMYESAEAMLEKAGYVHYEISNWCLPRRECAHNLIYWRNQPYLGFGAGAHASLPLPAVATTLLRDAPDPGDRWVRFSNVRRPEVYIASYERGSSPVDEVETLCDATCMAETMFLGLRLLGEGVRFAQFSSRFGLDARARYGRQLSELTDSKLITVDESRVCLTPKGRLLGNEVFRRFLEEKND